MQRLRKVNLPVDLKMCFPFMSLHLMCHIFFIYLKEKLLSEHISSNDRQFNFGLVLYPPSSFHILQAHVCVKEGS